MRETKQKPTIMNLPPQREGESDRAFNKRLCDWMNGDDTRSKGDLRDWKSADFTMAPERD